MMDLKILGNEVSYNRRTAPEFTRRDGRKPWKPSVGTSGFPAEIKTMDVPNITCSVSILFLFDMQ
jgi:hypothetical protein